MTLLINVCSGGIPKDHLVRKILVTEINFGGGSTFFKGSGLSVAPKPECGITQELPFIIFWPPGCHRPPCRYLVGL